MKRIVVFSHSCVVPANREFFEKLGGGGRELLIVCPRTWKGSLIRDLSAGTSAGLLAYPVVGSGNGSLFFYRSSLAEVKVFAPDLIFVDEEPWSLAALQVYAFFPRVKKIFYTKQNLHKKNPWPFRWIERFIFRRSAGALVISQETATVLRWKGYEGALAELPHALDPDRFDRLSAAEREVIRQDFGIPQKAFVAGYFGRLTEDKGLRDLFTYAEAELPRNSNICLLAVGNGPLAPEARALARRFPGQFVVLPALAHDTVHRLMGAMDVTLLPSRTTPRWKEQFGRVIIESAACGVPVIGSSSGEIPLLIAKARCGLAFAEGNVGELAEAIAKLRDNESLRSAVAEEGFRNVRARYSHVAVADSLVADLGRFSGASTNS